MPKQYLGSDFLKNLVGILPSAGYAKRLTLLPCSKEVYPVGYTSNSVDELSSPRVIASYLMECFEIAGVRHAYMIIRRGKWDIPQYFGDGKKFGVNLSYLVTEPTVGTPYTVNKAYEFVKGKYVVFGFPDILFKPKNAFAALLRKQKKSNADIILGLFPAENPQKMDMVDVDDNNKVRNIIIKPDKTDLSLTWIIAVWKPGFSEFMHTYLSEFSNHKPERDRELYMGDVIQAAIDKGMNVDSVSFAEGFYLDIGTTEDLKKAVVTDLNSL